MAAKPEKPKPVTAVDPRGRSPAKASPDRRGIVIDPVVVGVGGAVAAVGIGVLAVFLWMVPTAAAREAQSACRGLLGLEALDRQIGPDGRVWQPLNGSVQLCPDRKTPCQLPVPAPDFTAVDITGKQVKLSDFRGRVVLLNFWASWCGVCKAEKPALADMARELGGGHFEVITLVSDRTWSDALIATMASLAPDAPLPPRDENGQAQMAALQKSFTDAFPNNVPFKLLLDPPQGDDNLGPITQRWGITAVPESALIDEKGIIRAYFVNKRDWSSSVSKTCLRSVIEN